MTCLKRCFWATKNMLFTYYSSKDAFFLGDRLRAFTYNLLICEPRSGEKKQGEYAYKSNPHSME